MFHAPTVQQMIITACDDFGAISKHNEALMFSIYFLAILSLNDQECFSHFGDTRQRLLVKYTKGVQQALVNAKLLRTFNLTTLQAFLLYLVCRCRRPSNLSPVTDLQQIGGRRLYDAHTIYSLSGVAVRVAQRLGLHTDAGCSKMSPFDAEIRRRTWWQLVFLDGHASKLTGAPFPTWLTTFDTKLPVNISDSEMSPMMTEMPISKDGMTEMAFCAMRYETVQMIRNAPALNFHVEDGTGSSRAPSVAKYIEAKDKAIEQLQQIFEKKYLQHCDATIPLQVLILYMARSVVLTMKIMAHHPRNYPDNGLSMPQSERDMLFKMCVEELEIDSHGHENPMIQRYMWHVHVYFQLDAFIFMLSELRVRTTGELADRAWEQVRRVFHHRPEFITDTRNALFAAVGKFVLKAWAKREEAILHMGSTTPEYITKLRAVKATSSSKSNTESPQQHEPFDYTVSPADLKYTDSGSFVTGELAPAHQIGMWGNPFNHPDVLMPGVTSMEWEYWQTLMDGELPTFTADGAVQNWMTT
jgi:hypothetical protein